jgi:hypothetical protein
MRGLARRLLVVGAGFLVACNAVLGIDDLGPGPTDDAGADGSPEVDGTAAAPDGGAEAAEAGNDATSAVDAPGQHDATTGDGAAADAGDASIHDGGSAEGEASGDAATPEASPEDAGPEASSLDGAGFDAAQDAVADAAPVDAPPEAPSCDAGLVSCASACVNPLTSDTNCGAGPGCSPPGTACGSPYICVNGSCACPTVGNVNCGGTCIDPQSSPQHCGAGPSCSPAGSTCNSPLFCIGGSCSCPVAGNIVCSGKCIDPYTSPTYCGATGNCVGANSGVACPAGDVCSNGQCLLSCPSGTIDCGGSCINPQTSNIYCGATGNCSGANQGFACAAGYSCNAGSCAACPGGGCEICNDAGVCTLSCKAGLIDCNNSCINPQSDPTYCGAAGTCSVASSTVPPSAPSNLGNANSEGQNCGAAPDYVCINAACTLQCPVNQVACSVGGIRTCIDPTTDPNHCGATGACTNLAGSPVVPTGNNPNAAVEPAPTYGSPDFAGYTCANQTGAATNPGFGPGYQCQSSHCVLVCQAGQVICNAGSVPTCIDPTTNNKFCGASSNCSGFTDCTSSFPAKTCQSGVCK